MWWKFTRPLAFLRLHPNQTRYTTEKSHNPVTTFEKAHVSVSNFEKQKTSKQNERKKEHFNQRFWNCADFRFNVSGCIFLETASLISTTAVVSFNLHRHKFFSLFNDDKVHLLCPFSRNVLAVARLPNQDTESSENELLSEPEEFQKSIEVNVDSKLFRNIKNESEKYVISLYNRAGLKCLDQNNKKAFLNFLLAARLGSSQGLYNTGICYELGKGTKINLTKAAFCFRKAAMKGHGMASISLARYFHEGIGGLPVNHNLAKLLLEQAASQGFEEALIYLGLQYLEDGKYSDAFDLFKDLSAKGNIDGTYYLGLCYEEGWGVDKDLETAMEHFSKNARLEHSKSIMSLIKYYEKGLGGCDIDLDFALTLSQMLADQGHDEGTKEVLRLECKKEYEKTKSLQYLEVKKTGLHISSSVPEFTADKTSLWKTPFSFISSYIHLINDFIPFTSSQSLDENEASFYNGQSGISTFILQVPANA